MKNFYSEILFYFKHFFDTEYKMGIRQYKDQKLYVAFITFLPLLIFFIYLFFFHQSITHIKDFYDLPLEMQYRLESIEDFKLSILFIIATFFLKFFQLPYEIKRANFKNINWKIRVIILLLGFISIVAWSFYRFHQEKTRFLFEILFGITMLNLVFGKNGLETEEEKERYKIYGKHK
ncbi:hypothetical protein ACMGE7_07580 [Macrococcus equi]|uniref:hypothetical protein n=1 Tax=Macrococcus equi TaxID=3395462 RepID=UPI0039BDB56F